LYRHLLLHLRGWGSVSHGILKTLTNRRLLHRLLLLLRRHGFTNQLGAILQVHHVNKARGQLSAIYSRHEFLTKCLWVFAFCSLLQCKQSRVSKNAIHY
jgi:hypothetical protein